MVTISYVHDYWQLISRTIYKFGHQSSSTWTGFNRVVCPQLKSRGSFSGTAEDINVVPRVHLFQEDER